MLDFVGDLEDRLSRDAAQSGKSYEVMRLMELDTTCSWKGCGLMIDYLIKMLTFNFCSLAFVHLKI